MDIEGLTGQSGLKPAVNQPGSRKLTIIISSVAKPQFHVEAKFTLFKVKLLQ